MMISIVIVNFLIFRLKKINVVNYVPHNLGQYIELRTQCPSKRALLEKHFIVKKVRKEAKESCETTAAPVVARTETATATEEATNNGVQDSTGRVAVADKTSSEKATVQDTAKIFEAISSLASSSTTVAASSEHSEKSATVVPSQSTKPKTDDPTTSVTETTATNAIDATNQATAKVFFSESSKVIKMI